MEIKNLGKLREKKEPTLEEKVSYLWEIMIGKDHDGLLYEVEGVFNEKGVLIQEGFRQYLLGYVGKKLIDGEAKEVSQQGVIQTMYGFFNPIKDKDGNPTKNGAHMFGVIDKIREFEQQLNGIGVSLTTTSRLAGIEPDVLLKEMGNSQDNELYVKNMSLAQQAVDIEKQMKNCKNEGCVNLRQDKSAYCQECSDKLKAK